MRVKDLKNEKLRERVEEHMKFTHEPGFAERLNALTLPEGDGFMMLPHGRTIQIDASVGSEGSAVLPTTLLEHLIRNASHRVITNFCICRDGEECKNYPIDWGCLFLGDAAKKIDPEMGLAVSVEEALEYAEKCREAGLVQMVGRFTPDLHWLNPEVGPITKLITVCMCCPCCCGMRTIPDVKSELREQLLCRMPGVEIEVTDDCVGCGICVEKCTAYKGVELKDGKASIKETCRICGRCADACPAKAIRITVQSDYVDDAIANIGSRVDYR